MAIDTAAKRSSALDYEEVWQFGIPFPDGTISQADRQHLLWGYSGILAVTAIIETIALTLADLDTALSLADLDTALSLRPLDTSLTLDDK